MAIFVSRSDPVQIVFHRCRKVVVSQVRQVLFHQSRNREGKPGGNQVLSPVGDVAAIADGLNRCCIGRGATNSELFHGLHQGRFGVATRRLSLVSLCLSFFKQRNFPFAHLREGLLSIGRFRVVASLVLAFLVGQPEAGGSNDRSRGAGEHCVRLTFDLNVGPHSDCCGKAKGIRHLRSNGSLPDQVIKCKLLTIQNRGDLRGSAEVIPSGANGLVSFLRTLGGGAVDARILSHGLGPIKFRSLLAGSLDGLRGQGRGVGTHVGDEARLVQGLSGAHRRGSVPVELAGSFLLQRRSGEGRCGATAVGLLLNRIDRGITRGLERCGEERRRMGVQVEGLVLGGLRGETTVFIEIGTGCNGTIIDVRNLCAKRLARSGKLGIDRPILCAHMRHAVALAINNQARCDRLHAARRQGGTNLAPEQRRDLVTVKTVKDSTSFLGVDKVGVKLASIVQSALDRFLRDFVEDHAAHGNLGLEDLEKVPSDSLTFAVLISCQEEFVGLFQELLELGDLFLLVGIDNVIRGEAILNVDGEAPVGTLLHVGGQLRGLWQVANVTDRGGHMVVGSQVSFDRRRLSGRLHDHQLGRCHCLSLPLLPLYL